MKDYLADIEEFPIEAIQKACADWRRSGVTKFPTSGQLIPMIRKHLVEQLQERIGPWQQLNDDAYEALSLREKIRHHRILANEARRKAGPMWANGKPAEAEEMPPRWHEWSRKAEDHGAEAQRLMRFLKHPMVQAAE